MAAFFIIMMVVFGTAICTWAMHPVLSKLSESSSSKKSLSKKKDNLSEPAKRVVKKAATLPVDLQFQDVRSMVTALDIKYGRQAVDDHFRVSSYEPSRKSGVSYEESGDRYPGLFDEYVFSWHGDRNCKHLNGCKFPEYRRMMIAIEQVEIAREEQERALEISGIQHNLDAIESWTNRLREERSIITEITKELS